VGWLGQKWGGHPIFGQGVALQPPPTAGLGVVEPPPWPRGWSGHPKKPKKKKQSMGFGLLGLAGPPPWPWGWFDHPQTGRGGGSSHPLAKNGVVGATPLGQATPRFPSPPPPPFFRLLGVARPPSWPWGWFDHPHTGRGGGSSHPLAKNGVVGATPLGQATP
jgi:hypothetical protein